MADYEIWGPNDDGDETLLGVQSGTVPNKGDTIDIDGKERRVKGVTHHHSNGASVARVSVGQYDEGLPLPFVS